MEAKVSTGSRIDQSIAIGKGLLEEYKSGTAVDYNLAIFENKERDICIKRCHSRLS
jgi:hypothetical protein